MIMERQHIYNGLMNALALNEELVQDLKAICWVNPLYEMIHIWLWEQGVQEVLVVEDQNFDEFIEREIREEIRDMVYSQVAL
jgi:TPP-dependent indolepyruvate ferredoxin oxidoreductase alpha subunit